jgi:hypothetical protein
MIKFCMACRERFTTKGDENLYVGRPYCDECLDEKANGVIRVESFDKTPGYMTALTPRQRAKLNMTSS